MRVLVTGVKGQLGHDVLNELNRRDHEGIGTDRIEGVFDSGDAFLTDSNTYRNLDITEKDAVMEAVENIRPEAVIHCAAWTAVDMAEEDGKADAVRNVNVNGTKYVAEACKKAGAKMLYLSTDYVFDGQGTRPWKPDCENYRPLNVYGQSKLDGELAVAGTTDDFFIVRTAWVFGRNGNNFVKAILKAAEGHREVRVVNDQIGTPTYTPDLARLLVDMAETNRYGYYHATNEGGYISWYDFAVEIFRQAELRVKLIPVSTAEYGLSKAVRPFNSRLDRGKLRENGFKPLPSWKDALKRYLKDLGYGVNRS